MAKIIWNDFNIHFNDEGSGAPVLFVHGLGGNADNWLYQRKFFSTHRRVISINLPGHGRSDGETVNFMNYWETVSDLLDSLQLSEVDICGLSKGARVALMLARRRPKLVRSVAVVNSFMWLNDADSAERRQIYDLLLLPDGGQSWANALIAKMGLPFDSSIAKGFRHSLSTIHPEMIRDRFREMIDFDQRDELRELRCPVLIVRGQRDDFIPSYCASDMISRLFEASMIVFEECGHLPYLEQPKDFNSGLDAFYSGLKYGP